MFRRNFPVFVAFFLLSLPSFAFAEPRFGLWVEVEGKSKPFESLKNFKEFKQFSSIYEFSDLFCQIYRGGRSWFPTLLADDAPYRKAKEHGFDPLGETLRVAHERGQRVHAWLNVFRIWKNREAPILQVIGPRAVLVDSSGHSLLQYSEDGHPPGKARGHYQLGTPAIWLEPGEAKVQAYLLEVIRDLLLRYPALDGIHLDMIRYPFAVDGKKKSKKIPRPDYGYGKEVLKLFEAEFSGDFGAVRGDRWESWRRGQVTNFVQQVRELLWEMGGKQELSVAVLADSDMAHFLAYQDWPLWTKKNLVDFVLPMNYTADVSLAARRSKRALELSEKPVLMGLGAWLLLRRPQQLLLQAKDSFRVGAQGVVLFSYGNLQTGRGQRLLSQFSKSALVSLQNIK